MLPQIKANFVEQGYIPGAYCCSCLLFEAASYTAIGVMSYLGYKQVVPINICGWVTIALAAGAFLSFVAAGDLKKRKIDIISKAVLATAVASLGAVAGAKAFSPKQFAMALNISFFAYSAVIIALACIRAQRAKTATSEALPLFTREHVEIQ